VRIERFRLLSVAAVHDLLGGQNGRIGAAVFQKYELCRLRPVFLPGAEVNAVLGAPRKQQRAGGDGADWQKALQGF